MGIYIKGMKKPSDCQYCVMYRDGYCGAKGGFCRSEKGVDADCPIVEVVEVNESEIPTSSEKPNNCEDEPRKEQNFCGKCRYLYRDFKYGLSCYRLMDNEPCKYEERKDEPQIIACPIQEEDADYARWLYEDEPQTVLNDYSKADDCMECEKFFDCDAPDEVKHASRVTDCAWKKGE